MNKQNQNRKMKREVVFFNKKKSILKSQCVVIFMDIQAWLEHFFFAVNKCDVYLWSHFHLFQSISFCPVQPL